MPQTYIICTDGSCLDNPGPGGWAFEIWDTEITGDFPIMGGSGSSPSTTNNRMELSAMIWAIRDLIQSPHAPGLIKLHSDSQYVLGNMFQRLAGWKANNWKGSNRKVVANVESWKELDALIEQAAALGWTLEPDWVKGHAGEIGNERVDTIASDRAQEASRDLINGTPPSSDPAPAPCAAAAEEFSAGQISLLRSFIDPYASGDFSAKDVLRALRHNARSLGIA